MDKSHNDMIPKVLPPKSDISAYSSEYGSLVPTKEFYESFRENDKRAQERESFFRRIQAILKTSGGFS